MKNALQILGKGLWIMYPNKQGLLKVTPASQVLQDTQK